MHAAGLAIFIFKQSELTKWITYEPKGSIQLGVSLGKAVAQGERSGRMVPVFAASSTASVERICGVPAKLSVLAGR